MPFVYARFDTNFKRNRSAIFCKLDRITQKIRQYLTNFCCIRQNIKFFGDVAMYLKC